mmetsp:Transcript_25487/g.49843  ORF Transcript_25487/g.49843 Transcript_25487/m.49843 type:complete len:105 (-) Transcript_25487:1398-1712(-)
MRDLTATQVDEQTDEQTTNTPTVDTSFLSSLPLSAMPLCMSLSMLRRKSEKTNGRQPQPPFPFLFPCRLTDPQQHPHKTCSHLSEQNDRKDSIAGDSPNFETEG